MSSRILPEFELLMPQDINEALNFLDQHKDKVAIMAGGTDLIVLMKTGYAPDYILSLNDISELKYVNFDAVNGLRVGAMATLADVIESPIVKEKYPALYKSALKNGTPQTKNRATVLGNILRGSPAGDCCCATLAYGGSVILQGKNGRREVQIDNFWIDYRVTDRKPDELAVELRIPAIMPDIASSFSKMTRINKDIAKLNAAVCLQMNGKICKNARLAIGAVASVPLRIKRAEEIIEGNEITDTILENIQKVVREDISPIDDQRSTAEYRKQVAGVIMKRTIKEALADLN